VRRWLWVLECKSVGGEDRTRSSAVRWLLTCPRVWLSTHAVGRFGRVVRYSWVGVRSLCEALGKAGDTYVWSLCVEEVLPFR
jgi:hypothetical protein